MEDCIMYEIRSASEHDLDGARQVMLDTLYHEFGYGYQPKWHRDVIDIRDVYLDTPDHALFVAVNDVQVVGTAAVRAGGPRQPPHPGWLRQRYPDDVTAQLFRVYVHPKHRRSGLARRMVAQAVRFVSDIPRYRHLYLHTDARAAGAEAFWRSVATAVLDARDHDPSHFQTIHFEIPLPGR
jgi:GNAT superfamily N-acetyltransferase